MAIFNSYVKLPEGKTFEKQFFNNGLKTTIDGIYPTFIHRW